MGTGTDPVQILGVDEVRRAETREPSEEVAQADRRPNGPGPQPRADHLRRGGVRGVADEHVVAADIQAGEGDDALARGLGAGGDGRGDGEAEHHEALDHGAGHQDGAASHHVPH